VGFPYVQQQRVVSFLETLVEIPGHQLDDGREAFRN
jgi:hypothetical protein